MGVPYMTRKAEIFTLRGANHHSTMYRDEPVAVRASCRITLPGKQRVWVGVPPGARIFDDDVRMTMMVGSIVDVFDFSWLRRK